MNYLDFLNERASVRKFDPNEKIEEETIKEIVRSAANAPSGNNFQPWKVYAVIDKKKKEKLMAFTGGQKQVGDASVVFIMFGDLSLYNVKKIMDFNVEKGILSPDEIEGKAARVQAYLASHPENSGKEALNFDVGLFAMNLMHVVRAYGYESVPMRGVDFNKIKEYLDVPREYEEMLLLPVGKPIQAGYPHVRYDLEDVLKIIN